MKKHTATMASRRAGFLRVSCVTALLLTLGACNSSSGSKTPSTNDSGSVSTSDGSGSGSTSGGSGSGSNSDGSSSGSNDGGTVIDSAPAIKYFAADDGVTGPELWKTDGTPAGTVMVKEINAISQSGSTPDGFTLVNGVTYFRADDGVHGTELWKTDGTAEGTLLVKDINPEPGMSSSLGDLTVFNDALYFTADDGVHGREIWKTNGTAEGTVLVKDIKTAFPLKVPTLITVLNGALYFTVGEGPTKHGNGISNQEIWKTDGTPDGTVLVKNMNLAVENIPGIERFTAYNGALYFSGFDGVNRAELWNSAELWKTDGTPAGTVLVKDINTFPWGGSSPYGFTELNGMLYFAANDGEHGVELWKTDGTTHGTVLVKDINTQPGSGSYPRGMTKFNGMLYFSADNRLNNSELWKTDGTTEGTVLVKEINPAAVGSSYPAGESSSPAGFVVFNDALYFSASDNLPNFHIWKTDGTAEGTVMFDPALWLNWNILNGALYFTANDAVYGTELWKTNGTVGDKQLVKDICPGQCDGAKFYQ